MKTTRSNDKYLVEGILRGEEHALATFYTTYKGRLLSYIRRRIGLENDAEEILQDSLMGTLESLRDFAYQSSLYTFMCSIANHKVVDYYRKKKIKSVLFSQAPEIEALISTVVGPETQFDEQMLKEKIKATFATLTPQYHQILTLKYVQGYSVAEIAKKLSLSFKSVESQLFRARKAFVIAYG